MRILDNPDKSLVVPVIPHEIDAIPDSISMGQGLLSMLLWIVRKAKITFI